MWPYFIAGLVLLMLATARKAQAYVNGKPVDVQLESIGDGFQLRVDAAAAFVLMRTAAARVGVALKVNSAFRTNEEQILLHQAFLAGGAQAAAPGFSEHQGGMAVDIETANGSNSAYQWLVANAAHFGFKRTVSSEPWHWSFRP